MRVPLRPEKPRPHVSEHVAAVARRLAAEGLLIGTAGNVSVRGDERVAITGTGVALADCTADDVTVVGLDGRVIGGALVPSSELDLHLAVYARTDAAAVVHTHAPYATALACVLDEGAEMPVLHYQQLALGGPIRVAPYATFGTPALADHTVAALQGRQAALLANHGSVAVGPSLDKAVENALLLEWLAALHHRASALGTPRALTEPQQHDVIVQALERDYGRPQPRKEDS